MNLGAFSVSLAVKDLQRSLEFYQKLGFSIKGGDQSQGWLVLKSPTAVVGLFQGMFEQNILTFNPGWDEDAQPLDSFTDVRELHQSLKEHGFEFQQENLPTEGGPASFVTTDPDGNAILIDQHR